MKEGLRKLTERRYFFPLLLVLLTIAYFRETLFGSYFIPGLDAIVQNFPFKHFLSENLRSGRMPLWCSAVGGGCPLYAEGQGSFFYPLNILFLLMPAARAFNTGLFLAFLTMALSMYFYCRLIGIEKASSFLSAIIFVFGAFTALHLDNSNLLHAMSWTSVAVLFTEMFFRRGRPVYILLAGLAFAFQLLAGFPQMACYSFLFCAAYFIFRLTVSAKVPRKALVWAVAAAVTGAGIAAIQILPTMELAEVSSYKNVERSRTHPEDMLTFINPYILTGRAKGGGGGRPAMFALESHYIGLLSLLMVFLALPLILRNRFVSFFFFAAAFSLILIYVRPVFIFFARFVPGLGLFRFPQRLHFLVQFSFAVLAGFGAQRLNKKALKAGIIAATALELFVFGRSVNPPVRTERLMRPPESAAPKSGAQAAALDTIRFLC